MNLNLSMARISFEMTRNPQFYIYFLILPTFVITTTCLMALLSPVRLHLGEKVGRVTKKRPLDKLVPGCSPRANIHVEYNFTRATQDIQASANG